MSLYNNINYTILNCTLESRVNFSPHPVVCSATDSVELKCNISKDETMKWKIDWEHYFNGVYIQTIHGITDRYNAILEITFCDFRDNGQYICVWSSDTKKLSGSSLLTVYGKYFYIDFFFYTPILSKPVETD